MMLFRTSGLNFRRKRRKMKLSTAKSAACMGSGDSDRVTGGICAGVLCGNESDYGGKFIWSLPYQMAVRYW